MFQVYTQFRHVISDSRYAQVVIAVVQLTSVVDVDHNLERAAHWIRRAARQGAELIALPENFAYMPDSDEGSNPSAQDLDPCHRPSRGAKQPVPGGPGKGARYSMSDVGTRRVCIPPSVGCVLENDDRR